MKNNDRFTSVVGVGFWSDVRVNIGGPGLVGRKGICVGISGLLLDFKMKILVILLFIFSVTGCMEARFNPYIYDDDLHSKRKTQCEILSSHLQNNVSILSECMNRRTIY